MHAQFQIFDLTRNLAQLRGRENADLDGALEPLFDLFLELVGERMLGIVDGHHTNAHAFLRRCGGGKPGSECKCRRGSYQFLHIVSPFPCYVSFYCFDVLVLEYLPEGVPGLVGGYPNNRTSASVSPGQAVITARAKTLMAINGMSPR